MTQNYLGVKTVGGVQTYYVAGEHGVMVGHPLVGAAARQYAPLLKPGVIGMDHFGEVVPVISDPNVCAAFGVEPVSAEKLEHFNKEVLRALAGKGNS